MLVHANGGQLLIIQHIIDYWTVLFMHLNNIQILDNLSVHSCSIRTRQRSTHTHPQMDADAVSGKCVLWRIPNDGQSTEHCNKNKCNISMPI